MNVADYCSLSYEREKDVSEGMNGKEEKKRNE